MAEEQEKQLNNQENQKPRVTVGIFVFNKQGEILLIRSPKWGDRLVVPGGHVEYGENIEKAAKREIKEEVGLDIKDLEFIIVDDLIESAEFVVSKRHFICLDYKAQLIDEKQHVVLDNREAVEYLWIKPKDAVGRNDIESLTKKVITGHLLKDKKSFFKKSCNDCEKFKKETEEYKTGWQRALADYKNLQKEIFDRRAEWAQMSEQQILEEFLPVYDNFKLAFRLQTTDYSPEQQKWIDGIKHIKQQFEGVLKAHGIEEIKTVNEVFNPELHEAVGDEQSDQPEHQILKEIDTGYKMRGKVIKAAKVIVVKKEQK